MTSALMQSVYILSDEGTQPALALEFNQGLMAGIG
jgi:hypothetical protein